MKLETGRRSLDPRADTPRQNRTRQGNCPVHRNRTTRPMSARPTMTRMRSPMAPAIPGTNEFSGLPSRTPPVHEGPLEFGGYVRPDALDHLRMECADAGRNRRHHHEHPSGDLMVDRVHISAVGIPRSNRGLTRNRRARAEPEHEQGGPGHERTLASASRLRPEACEYDAVEEEGEDHKPRKDSYHDEEAPARTEPLPTSRDRHALPFPVHGRLCMGHRARGRWPGRVRNREDRQQASHRLS